MVSIELKAIPDGEGERPPKKFIVPLDLFARYESNSTLAGHRSNKMVAWATGPKRRMVREKFRSRPHSRAENGGRQGWFACRDPLRKPPRGVTIHASPSNPGDRTLNAHGLGGERMTRRSFVELACVSLMGLGLSAGCGGGAATGTSPAPEGHSAAGGDGSGPAGEGLAKEKPAASAGAAGAPAPR